MPTSPPASPREHDRALEALVRPGRPTLLATLRTRAIVEWLLAGGVTT